MLPFVRRCVCILAVAILTRGSAAGLELEVTRADLARAYLRFERALAAHPLTPDTRPAVNREFDALTSAFFSGDQARVLEQLDALTLRVDPSAGATPEQRFLDSLRVRTRTAWTVVGRTDPLPIEIVRLHAVEGLDPETEITVRYVVSRSPAQPGDAGVERSRTVRKVRDLPAVGETWSFDAGPTPAELRFGGRSRIVLTCGAREFVARVLVQHEAPLTEVCARLALRLEEVEVDGPPMEQALASSRARLDRLPRVATDDEVAVLIDDPFSFSQDLANDVTALERGRDPLRRRPGTTWRVLKLAERRVPLCVHAPLSACTDVPVPLVIALHGAGGDESMFIEGYGAGRIAALADEQHFVVASPAVGFLGLDGPTFDALVDALAYTYAIDPARIYVIGHSLGASSAASLAASRSERLAAAVCIAGGPLQRQVPGVPLRVVAGELDPLMRVAVLESAVKKLASAGAPVEFVVEPGWGHTLVVGHTLPTAITWLLERHR